MTATVTVRTRAWPATLTVKSTGEEHPVPERSERSFDVKITEDFTVTINPPPEAARDAVEMPAEPESKLESLEGVPQDGQPIRGRRAPSTVVGE